MKTAPLRPKTLLFDLDGTLVDCHEFPMRIEFAFRSLRYLSTQMSFSSALAGLRHSASTHRANNDHPELTVFDRTAHRFAHASGQPQQASAEILERGVRTLFPKFKKYFFPIPGASDFVEWAYQHYPLHLVTTPVWIPEAVQWRLEWGGISMTRFRSFTHSKRMHSTKPEASYYEEFFKQENLNPAECLMIGNDPSKDIPNRDLGLPVWILDAQDKEQSYANLRTQLELGPS